MICAMSIKNIRLDGSSRFLFYLGIFFIGFALLASEILLTRFLSVVFYYHFAFFVVSVVLFGMTLGALLVYFLPRYFLPDFTYRHIALYAYIASVFTAGSFVALFWLPAVLHLWGIGDLTMPVLYILLSVPFVAFGIVLSLAFTRFSGEIHHVYASNLIGSASGCLGVIFLLNTFKNGVSALFVIACLGVLSACCFLCYFRPGRAVKRLFAGTMCLLVFLSWWNVSAQKIRPLWVKDNLRESANLYETWNYFSTVSVNRPAGKLPSGWGYSPKITSIQLKTEELMLQIEYDAGTALINFQDLSDIDYLKMDVTAIAYYVRPPEDVVVLGSGGGRDLLTAVLFGARKVTGVEINKDINDVAFHKFKFFSGSILNYPQIHFAVDEGRSFISKSRDQFNIIQSSLVDSFASAFNGAFALMENGLYTTEAWETFLGRLKDNGILTFSHFYFSRKPYMMYRFLALARASLRSIGVTEPREHIVLVRQRNFVDETDGIGTILVSRSPFTPQELARLQAITSELGFEIVFSSTVSADPYFLKVLESPESGLGKAFPFDITAPTDNKPFYFHFSKIQDFFSRNPGDQGVVVLRKLLFVIGGFGLFFIVAPLVFHWKGGRTGRVSRRWAFYFFLLGLGFMLVEIALMQRLGIFLGHPIYGLTVVLFALLFSSGVGSFLARHAEGKKRMAAIFVPFLALLGALTYLLPFWARVFNASPMFVKIALAAGMVVGTGLFMGMPFPAGLKRAALPNAPSLVMYWGINGFASVCGSAIAATLLIYFGFQWTLTAGFVCYALAFFLIFPKTGDLAMARTVEAAG